MSFEPSHIAYENIRQIPESPWSILRHSSNCIMLWHSDFDRIHTRNYNLKEELHLTVFFHRNRVDYHATWVYVDCRGKFYKRHHGYKCQNGRRLFKNTNRPVQLRSIFSEFERDLPNLERHIARIMVSLLLYSQTK